MDEETDTQTTTDQPQRLATTLCSPSSFIAEVLRKDEAAVDELKTLVPEYTPPDEYAALHTRGKQALETLDEMTSLLRSAICICERQGTATNWEGFAASIRKLGLSGVTARTYRQANMKTLLFLGLCLMLTQCATNYAGRTRLSWWLSTHEWLPPFRLQP